MPDEKSAPGGDLAELLRGARDVAGLSADRAARQGDHEQSAGAARHRREERVGKAKRDEAERERDDERRTPGGGERARSSWPAAAPAPSARPAAEARAASARRAENAATSIRLSAARQNPPSSAAVSAPTRRMSGAQSRRAVAPMRLSRMISSFLPVSRRLRSRRRRRRARPRAARRSRRRAPPS